MTLQKAALLAITLSLGACSSLIQSTSLSEAYKQYERQEFERTLELITRAENAQEPTPEIRAELIYLKARSYEGLGKQEVASALYRYLVDHHKDSQYGYLASTK